MQDISERGQKDGLYVVTNDHWVSLTLRSRDHSQGCVSADSAEYFGAGVWWLARLKIHPDYQRQGFGTALLKRLQEELVKKPGFKRLLVAPGGYNSDPTRLFEFYRRHGFKDREDGALIWELKDETRRGQAACDEQDAHGAVSAEVGAGSGEDMSLPGRAGAQGTKGAV